MKRIFTRLLVILIIPVIYAGYATATEQKLVEKTIPIETIQA